MSVEKPEDGGAEGAHEATQPGQPAADASTPPEAPAHTDTAPPERSGFLVPVWLAAVLATLLVFGVGFLIGWVAAPGGGGHDGSARIGRVFPGGRGGPNGGPNGGPGGGGPFGGLPGPQGNQAFLGIGTAAATGGQSGVQVATVQSGSPADQAGLKAGDVITAVDGNAVTTPQELAQRIRAHQPGDQVTITYTRSGASAQASVKLGTRPGVSVPSSLPQTPS